MKHLLPLFLLLSFACSAPINPSFGGEQWARTPIACGEPGCAGGLYATITSSAAFVLRKASNGTPALLTLPVQLKLVVTGTASIEVCQSQDPSPIINRQGRFTADSAGYYAAGGGPCQPAYVNDVVGFTIQALVPSGSGAIPPGAKPYSCVGTLEPCSVASDCTGGVACSVTTKALTTYIFVLAEAGSGTTVRASEVQ